MRSRVLVLVASLALPVALYACAGDDDPPPGPKNLPAADSATSPGAEGGVDAAPDAPIDQSAIVPLRCTQAELDANDQTGATTPIAIVFPLTPGTAQYSNNCVKVKAGAVVNFTGSFVNHPLEPNGGDVPTPIPASTSADPPGGTLAVTMTAAGTFGYQCTFHPGTMFGAIQVVP